MLPTGQAACSDARAACHVSGTPMPPEIAATAGVTSSAANGAGPTAATGAPPSAGSAATVPPAAGSAAVAPSPDPDSRAADEHGDYIEVEWGPEITFDEMIAIAQRGELTTIEWYALPNAIRVITTDRQYYHVKNEKYGRSARKELVAAGVKLDRGGIPLNYYFCN